MKIIVCRVGQPPVWETLSGDTLKAMQKIVGGYIELVRLPHGLELWCNEEGLMNGSKMNRVIESDMGTRVVAIHGDFLLCRCDKDGGVLSATEADFIWANSL